MSKTAPPSALQGACFLVTGAGRGIGKAIAEYLVQSGARVVVTDLAANKEAIQSLAQEQEILAAPLGDVAEEAFCVQLIEEAIKLAGPSGLDGLVNNAGVGLFSAVAGGTGPEEVQRCFNVNAAAPLRLAQLFAATRIASGQTGSIVNISSMSSSTVFPNHTAYSTSKAALDQITHHLAVELGPHQIRSNAVLPTIVRTEMGKTAWPDDAPETKKMLARIPLRRFAEPEEIASVVAFLLDRSRSGMINGALLPVDGGFLSYGGV
mmetsp:Transcript_48384/g.90636  ORF Transcript_48384/g.90636 Transcript_48384/m.90636 type:complete len:264 (-) Transcript_48384:235-1026(-)